MCGAARSTLGDLLRVFCFPQKNRRHQPPNAGLSEGSEGVCSSLPKGGSEGRLWPLRAFPVLVAEKSWRAKIILE